ncbi:retrotransposon protein, putative, ty1-copia subclass [Tanacetum coccineum]
MFVIEHPIPPAPAANSKGYSDCKSACRVNALYDACMRWTSLMLGDVIVFGYVYLLKHKHEVFETFKVFKNEVENQLGKTIKALRSDQGGEYISQKFKDYLKDCGIVQQLTLHYTKPNRVVATRISICSTKKVDKFNELWYGKFQTCTYLKVLEKKFKSTKSVDGEGLEEIQDEVYITSEITRQNFLSRSLFYWYNPEGFVDPNTSRKSAASKDQILRMSPPNSHDIHKMDIGFPQLTRILLYGSASLSKSLEGLYFDPSGYAWCYTYAYIQEGVTFIAKSYACSDSLLLTPLCCDDIHEVTPRVSALEGLRFFRESRVLKDVQNVLLGSRC